MEGGTSHDTGTSAGTGTVTRSALGPPMRGKAPSSRSLPTDSPRKHTIPAPPLTMRVRTQTLTGDAWRTRDSMHRRVASVT